MPAWNVIQTRPRSLLVEAATEAEALVAAQEADPADWATLPRVWSVQPAEPALAAVAGELATLEAAFRDYVSNIAALAARF